jgi:hypothetical protein
MFEGKTKPQDEAGLTVQPLSLFNPVRVASIDEADDEEEEGAVRTFSNRIAPTQQHTFNSAGSPVLRGTSIKVTRRSFSSVDSVLNKSPLDSVCNQLGSAKFSRKGDGAMETSVTCRKEGIASSINRIRCASLDEKAVEQKTADEGPTHKSRASFSKRSMQAADALLVGVEDGQSGPLQGLDERDESFRRKKPQPSPRPSPRDRGTVTPSTTDTSALLVDSPPAHPSRDKRSSPAVLLRKQHSARSGKVRTPFHMFHEQKSWQQTQPQIGLQTQPVPVIASTPVIYTATQMINNFFASSSSSSATQPVVALDPPPETSMTDRSVRATAKRGLDANLLDMYRDEMQEYFSHQDRGEIDAAAGLNGQAKNKNKNKTEDLLVEEC